MARMSIDDKFPRDPRVIKLGRRFGWSRREAMGALIDVYQVAYDRERDVLPAEDIDIAAEREGFVAVMVECELAEYVGSGVRIRGAAERIAYLNHKAEAGRIGGVKSGESRRNRREAERSTASSNREARGNPPDPVPDPPPDPVPEDQNLPPAREIPPSTEPAQPPEAPRPAPVPAPAWGMPNPAEVARLRMIGDLALATWKRVSDERMERARALKLAGVLPLPTISPGHQPKAFDELRQRIREEGAAARDVCDHVVKVLVGQAKDTKSIEWLSEKAFLEGSWRTARSAPLGGTKSQATPPSRAPPPLPHVIPADELAGPADFAAARAALGLEPQQDPDP